MKKFLNESMFKYGWWFIFNLLVTLFIVSLLGIGGGQGEDGLDGQDGAYVRDIIQQTYEVKPTGAARTAYAQGLVEEGYLAIDELADFETYFQTDFENLSNWTAYNVLVERNFVLLNDIDFAEAEEVHLIPNGFYYDFGGSTDFDFEGIFDGAGFSILNYTRASTSIEIGFFPSVGSAIIKNITFINADVTYLPTEGNAEVGVVVGEAEYNLDLINVTVEDSLVVGSDAAGGLVGRTDNTTRIINSHVMDSNIYGRYEAGGFIGNASSGDLLFAYSSNQNTEVNGLDNEFFDRSNGDYGMDAGGFVGEVDNQGWVYVYQSYNTGYVASQWNPAGGFFGDVSEVSRLFIAQSFNNGLIESYDAEAGGLIGDIYLDFTLTIQDSFNAGTIFSSDTGGGIIGRLDRDGGYPEVELINVYNAGRILSDYNTDEFGGIIGDVDSSLILNIRNSFNVGEFSNSLVENNDLFNYNFPMNGSIIGEVDEVLLSDVFFYVNLDRLDYYLPTATDKQFDFGSDPIYDHAKFTSEDFILNQAWDFDRIWEFNEGYAYPTLQALVFTAINPTETDYAPNVDVWINNFEFIEVESGYSPVELNLDYLEISDVEDKASELTLEIRVSTTLFDENALLEDLIEASTSMYSGLGYPNSPIGVGSFTPQTSDLHYVYFLVTDTDGNKTFTQRGDFTPIGGDTEAPTIDPTLFSANFANNDVAVINLTLTTGTDNVTAEADLTYRLLASTSTEVFIDAQTAYDAYLNDVGLIYQAELTPTTGVYEISLFSLTQFSFGVEYYASVLVIDEAGNVSLYNFVTMTALD